MFLTLPTLLNFRRAFDLGSKTFIHFANVFAKWNNILDLVTVSYLSLSFSANVKLLIL